MSLRIEGEATVYVDIAGVKFGGKVAKEWRFAGDMSHLTPRALAEKALNRTWETDRVGLRNAVADSVPGPRDNALGPSRVG